LSTYSFGTGDMRNPSFNWAVRQSERRNFFR
jgi:hypothetical protein